MTDGSILAVVIADLVAMVPSSVAESFFSEPPKAPKGVRFAATMNILDMVILSAYCCVGAASKDFDMNNYAFLIPTHHRRKDLSI